MKLSCCRNKKADKTNAPDKANFLPFHVRQIRHACFQTAWQVLQNGINFIFEYL